MNLPVFLFCILFFGLHADARPLSRKHLLEGFLYYFPLEVKSHLCKEYKQGIEKNPCLGLFVWFEIACIFEQCEEGDTKHPLKVMLDLGCLQLFLMGTVYDFEESVVGGVQKLKGFSDLHVNK